MQSCDLILASVVLMEFFILLCNIIMDAAVIGMGGVHDLPSALCALLSRQVQEVCQCNSAGASRPMRCGLQSARMARHAFGEWVLTGSRGRCCCVALRCPCRVIMQYCNCRAWLCAYRAAANRMLAGCDGRGGAAAAAVDVGLEEALVASKLDHLAAEYSHLLVSQLDAQRAYFDGLLQRQARRFTYHMYVTS